MPNEKTNIPAIVIALASQAKGNPIAWKQYPDRTVIVFEDGRKLIFEKASETEAATVSQPNSGDRARLRRAGNAPASPTSGT